MRPDVYVSVQWMRGCRNDYLLTMFPQNMEAEPTQWFPKWASQGPPKGHEAGLSPGSPAGPCFIHRVPSGILFEITRSAAKLFSFFFFFLIFHLEIIPDFKNFKSRNRTLK